MRYVQLWHGAGQPWDNHAGLEAAHRNLAGEIDQPIAALMTDLKQRGMFEETLILWGGEFGRTPTVELSGDGKPQSGRDHNHWGFSVWLAGGGIKGGTTYGTTDEIGFKAAENPVSVHDLHATMLHCLGFDHKQLTFRYAGRDFRLTPSTIKGGGPIVGFRLGDVLLVFAEIEEPAVDFGVEGLHPAIEHFREAGVLGYIGDGQARIAQQLGGAAGGGQGHQRDAEPRRR